jgi:hypothetical protein
MRWVRTSSGAATACSGCEVEVEKMDNDDVILPGDLAWLRDTRTDLHNTWRTKGRYVAKDGRNLPLSCRLADAANPNLQGHLSLPCSVGQDADEIEAFLGSVAYDGYPVAFLRFYLFLLDEFGRALDDAYHRIDANKSLPGTLTELSVWTNNYAKHRVDFLVQHHPKYLFLDNPKAAALVPKLPCPDILVIDLRKPHEVVAHRYPHAVLMVPKLRAFLDPLLRYYAKFVEHAEQEVANLQKFHSPHHQSDMIDLLDKLLR